MEIKSDWIVSDNTTLTDSARFITYDTELDSQLGRHYFANWLNFIESLVLHKKIGGCPR